MHENGMVAPGHNVKRRQLRFRARLFLFPLFIYVATARAQNSRFARNINLDACINLIRAASVCPRSSHHFLYRLGHQSFA